MPSTISEAICKWINTLGTSHVFMVPGIQVENLSWAMAADEGLTVVVACHEMGAGFMADGYARASGKPGVCMGIGGPGASYLLPSAMIARVDDSPVLYITGDVPQHVKEYFCFQDSGLNGSRDREAFKCLIDFSVVVNHPSSLHPTLELIAHRLNEKLPAHLVIPCDVQVAAAVPLPETCNSQTTGTDADKRYSLDESHVILELLKQAKHPLILAGHRLWGAKGSLALTRFAETFGVRVATTYRAKGILPEDHPLSLGIFGYAGTMQALHALLGEDCDLLLIIGASLSQRNTLSFDERLFPGHRKVIFIDTREMNPVPGNPMIRDIIIPDITAFLEHVIAGETGLHKPKASIRRVMDVSHFATGHDEKSYKGFPRLDWAIRTIRNAVPPESMLFVDSGAHRIIAGGSWMVIRPGTFFTSDNMAPMGWAICAAIGAKFARPKALSIVLTGDGCMRMHGMELATAARYSIPVIVIVSNNGTLHSVRHRATTDISRMKLADLPVINWVEFGRSIGAAGSIVENPDDLTNAIHHAMISDKPYIIDIRTHPDEPFSDEITLTGTPWPYFRYIPND